MDASNSSFRLKVMRVIPFKISSFLHESIPILMGSIQVFCHALLVIFGILPVMNLLRMFPSMLMVCPAKLPGLIEALGSSRGVTRSGAC